MNEELFLILDCETAPFDNTIEKVDAHNMIAYDLGWAIVDAQGKVYDTQSFVIADVFLNEKALMKNAYYADKIPTYWNDIKSGKRTLATFYNVRKALAKDIVFYGIKQVFGHNMRFDYTALNQTQRWVTKSKYRYFLPYGIEVCDTLKMARQTFGKDKDYRKFCEDNNYLTANGQLRMTAEILYRYLTNNLDFEEVHCGLDDCLIEKDILVACLAMNPLVERNLWKRG